MNGSRGPRGSVPATGVIARQRPGVLDARPRPPDLARGRHRRFPARHFGLAIRSVDGSVNSVATLSADHPPQRVWHRGCSLAGDQPRSVARPRPRTPGDRLAADSGRHRLAASSAASRDRRRDAFPPRPGTSPRAWASPGRPPVPGLGLSSPIVWGDLTCVSTSISGQKDAGLKVGLYGDVKPVLDDTEHEWRIYCLDKKTGAVRWQQTVLKAVPEDQAAHQSLARELDARDRRRAPDRLLRIGRALRLRPQGQAALAEGPRRARRRLVHSTRRRNGKPGVRPSFTTTSSSSRPTSRRDRSSGPSTPGAARSCGASRGATCRRGARPRCIRSTARRSSSSTAGGTSAPTTSRPARKSGS